MSKPSDILGLGTQGSQEVPRWRHRKRKKEYVFAARFKKAPTKWFVVASTWFTVMDDDSFRAEYQPSSQASRVAPYGDVKV